jgi:hypothetical protein
LQVQLVELLRRLGYFRASELSLRIDPEREPRPDVAGALTVDGRYPTKPIDVAIEILSDDQMTRLFEKCRQYVRIGIPQIFVFDTEARVVWEWSRKTGNFERIDTLVFGNGSSVEAAEIWMEFEGRIPRDSAGRAITLGFEFSNSINPPEWLLSRTGVHPILKLENHFNALLWRHAEVFLHVGGVGFLEAGEDSDHFLHSSIL